MILLVSLLAQSKYGSYFYTGSKDVAQLTGDEEEES
jgi:hypothetical protein